MTIQLQKTSYTATEGEDEIVIIVAEITTDTVQSDSCPADFTIVLNLSVGDGMF